MLMIIWIYNYVVLLLFTCQMAYNMHGVMYIRIMYIRTFNAMLYFVFQVCGLFEHYRPSTGRRSVVLVNSSRLTLHLNPNYINAGLLVKSLTVVLCSLLASLHLQVFIIIVKYISKHNNTLYFIQIIKYDKMRWIIFF